MANKDLFKQAIAEAKSVREAAIANAKEALEETLTPHLKEMLAAKLQEMEDASYEEVVKEEDEEQEFTFEEETEEAEEAEADIDSEEFEEEAEEETEEEEIEVKDMEVGDLKDLIRDIISQEMEDGMEGGIEGEELPDELPGADMIGVEDEEEIDLDELLREISEMEHGEGTDKGYTNETDGIPSGLGFSKDNDIAKGIRNLTAGAKKAGVSVAEFMKQHGVEVGSATRAISGEQVELREAMKTIKNLKGQLSEINLLNAKLLYVNKVFKANNLSESQKVNIIAAFDKAETVKEAKLVFETVAGNVGNSVKKASIRESKANRGSKLGMASKATGLTASKPEVISEVSDAVKRMQKLAGIIK